MPTHVYDAHVCIDVCNHVYIDYDVHVHIIYDGSIIYVMHACIYVCTFYI
jgi:hypothetical protein